MYAPQQPRDDEVTRFDQWGCDEGERGGKKPDENEAHAAACSGVGGRRRQAELVVVFGFCSHGR